MSYVIGLDLSLTGTGVARVHDRGTVWTQRVASKAPQTPRDSRTGKPTQATLQQRRRRLMGLAAQVVAETLGADLVVVQQPAFSASGGQHHDRSGLWWLVVNALMAQRLPVVEVTPGQLKKYATGKGTGGKDEVLAAVVRRYPEVPLRTNDEADALVLACMGARHMGFPLEGSLPKQNLEGMAAVRWPVRESGA